MRTTSLAAAAAAAATTAVLTAGLAGPLAGSASAESYGIDDPADVHHGVDLRAVHINHAKHNVRITLSHTNLRRDPSTGAGGAVYIDTDPDDRGPEMVLVGGYFEGTDYALLHTEGFAPKTWGEPVEGSYEMRLDYAKEQTRIRISRATLGRPDRVRVGVKVAGRRTDGTQVVDWMGKPYSWSLSVDRD